MGKGKSKGNGSELGKGKGHGKGTEKGDTRLNQHVCGRVWRSPPTASSP